MLLELLLHKIAVHRNLSDDGKSEENISKPSSSSKNEKRVMKKGCYQKISSPNEQVSCNF